MIADAFVVLLPDETLHYARPGHVGALCGANRVSNADVVDEVEADCPACRLLSGRHDDLRGEAVCPDCSTIWPRDCARCPGCGLSLEDVEAAADFWVALGPGEL